jgi:hypothetical protein
MIFVVSEKKNSTAKKRDIATFKVNGQSHIILQQLSCGTRSNVSFVSNPAQIENMPGGTPWGQAQLRIFDRKFLPALKITELVFFFL